MAAAGTAIVDPVAAALAVLTVSRLISGDGLDVFAALLVVIGRDRRRLGR